MTAADTLAAVLAIAEKPPVGYTTPRTNLEDAFNEGVAVMAGQVRDLVKANGGDRITATLALHIEVVNVRGGSVCSTCFTDDEEPEPYPCRTRRLLDGDAS